MGHIPVPMLVHLGESFRWCPISTPVRLLAPIRYDLEFERGMCRWPAKSAPWFDTLSLAVIIR